jgi:hypothetical protein
MPGHRVFEELLIVLQAYKWGRKLGKPYDDPIETENDRLGDGGCNKDKKYQHGRRD